MSGSVRNKLVVGLEHGGLDGIVFALSTSGDPVEGTDDVAPLQRPDPSVPNHGMGTVFTSPVWWITGLEMLIEFHVQSGVRRIQVGLPLIPIPRFRDFRQRCLAVEGHVRLLSLRLVRVAYFVVMATFMLAAISFSFSRAVSWIPLAICAVAEVSASFIACSME